MTPKEIRQYVKLMRSQGVLSLKLNGLELVLNPNFKPKERSKRNPQDAPLSNLDNSFRGYSEEELLGWSSTKVEG